LRVNSGSRFAAVSRGKDKEELALRLGAHRYIDAGSTNAAEELIRLGGARVILATAPNSAAISELSGVLGRNGMLLAIAGTADPLKVSPAQLIGRRAFPFKAGLRDLPRTPKTPSSFAPSPESAR
jgi:D-arabinose 1-dehydrogenase-like Zn-dependent alcohol dehydrogenase